MRNNFLRLLLILLPCCSLAQVAPSLYYFDKNLNLCSKTKSALYGEGTWEGGNYRLDLYRNKNHYHIFTAHYTDSTFATMNGQFVSYYENGAVENLMYYKDGNSEGVSVKWAPDHRLLDSAWYANGANDSDAIYHYNFSTGKIEYVARNNYITKVTIKTRYDDNGNAIEHDATDTVSAEEAVVITNPDEEAEFPGSDSSMNNYFQYRFSQDRFNLIIHGTSEACSLIFIVDKNGKASDVRSKYCDNYELRNIMADAVRYIVWLPATKNGQPVASVKEVSEIYSPSIAGLTNDKQRRYFFDRDFNTVDDDDAPYFGKLTADKDLVKLTVHYKQHSNTIFSMHFTDSTLQMATGEFESSYDQKEVRGNFLLGRKNGWWVERSETGQPIDSSLYVNKVKTYEETTIYQPEGAPGKKIIRDYMNNQERTILYDRRTVTSDVTVPLFGTGISDNNNVFIKPEVEPSFPGGYNAWSAYVDEYLDKNFVVNRRDGTCIVRFVVDTDGKVYDAQALTMRGSPIARAMINAVMGSPEWIPAKQNGKKVKAYVMSEMHYTIIRVSAPAQKRYIQPVIINGMKIVNPIIKSR